VLWIDKINIKRVIIKSPFQFVYGMEVVLLIELEIPMMKLLHDKVAKLDTMKRRINQLVKLQDKRDQVYHRLKEY
jgi:hypothetical protein